MFEFYRDKSVFVTGHTGFKGTWLCRALCLAGADVTGYALEPPSNPNLFELSQTKGSINSVIGDIRDLNRLKEAFYSAKPQIVFHLAAQPIVLEGYKNPVYTYETNVLGTANILECVRTSDCVRSVLNITTDKVYKNIERSTGYREDEALDGFDPYSNSKSCSELVTACYKRSFLNERNVTVSTARAGNVIGGGDFAENRIIPDCFRAALSGDDVVLRNPSSVRPYQHVLEPVFAYMMIAEKQFSNADFADSYNVGPDDCDCITTRELANLFKKSWGDGIEIREESTGGPHEAGLLRLDCSKLKETFKWSPVWKIDRAVYETVKWLKAYKNNLPLGSFTDEQIKGYFEEWKKLNV